MKSRIKKTRRDIKCECRMPKCACATNNEKTTPYSFCDETGVLRCDDFYSYKSWHWNMSTVSNVTSKLFVANSFPVCFVNYVILGGGGGDAHPARPRKEVVQHADLGSKRAFLHHLLQVLYRLSMQDSSATWLTTGKHVLWIAITKQSNVLQNSIEWKVSK